MEGIEDTAWVPAIKPIVKFIVKTIVKQIVLKLFHDNTIYAPGIDE